MTLGLDPRTQGRLLAVMLLFSTLLAGILTGVALTHVFGDPEREIMAGRGLFLEGPGFPRPPGPPPGVGHGPIAMHTFGIGDEFVGLLDLTPLQRGRVDSILTARGPRAEAIFEEMEPRLKALMDSTNAQIREILTPEQREKFDEYRDERRDFLIERFDVRGPMIREKRVIRR